MVCFDRLKKMGGCPSSLAEFLKRLPSFQNMNEARRQSGMIVPICVARPLRQHFLFAKRGSRES
jgi:hypothetical protein